MLALVSTTIKFSFLVFFLFIFKFVFEDGNDMIVFIQMDKPQSSLSSSCSGNGLTPSVKLIHLVKAVAIDLGIVQRKTRILGSLVQVSVMLLRYL